MAVPTEADVHSHEHQAGTEEQHDMHIGFIEEWYLVNPAAVLGILLAYFLPRTKLPHAFHILISTWASSMHIMMNTYQPVTAVLIVGIFVVLFIAVWLPCCFSDIIFPMLLVKSEGEECVFCKDGHHHG